MYLSRFFEKIKGQAGDRMKENFVIVRGRRRRLPASPAKMDGGKQSYGKIASAFQASQ